MSACGKKTETIDNSAYADQTVTGKVTEMKGSVVTLQLGELSESSDRPDAAGSENGTPPAKPDGGSAVSDNAVITVGSGCTWTLTGDCTVTSVTNNGTINFNGYTVTLADGTVLK